MDIKIRSANANDAKAIAGLLSELGYPQDQTFVKKKLLEINYDVIVAETEGIVAGVIAFDSQPLFHEDGSLGSIMALAVTERYRSLGIGKNLVAHIEQLARAKGCTKIAVASGMRRERSARR